MGIGMKRLAGLCLVIGWLALAAPAALAKGPAQRIIITGPGLQSALVVTHEPTLYLLSMGTLENFVFGPIDEPSNLGEWYELERQFDAGGQTYRTFDRVRYYPDSDGGRGYVFYVGIENGSSEYDGRWFYANPEGEAAMRRALAGVYQPYLLLARDGRSLHFFDPDTLAEVASVQVADDPAYVSNVKAAYDGGRIFFTRFNGSATEQRMIDLATGDNCRLSETLEVIVQTPGSDLVLSGGGALEIWDAHSFALKASLRLSRLPVQFLASPDNLWLIAWPYGRENAQPRLFDVRQRRFFSAERGLTLPHTDDNPYSAAWDPVLPGFYLSDGQRLLITYLYSGTVELDLPLRLESAGPPEQIRLIAGRDWRVYLHYARGRYWLYDYDAEDRGEIPGGVIVVNARNGRQIDHWQPDLAFAQVIAGGESLYGIQALRDTDRVELIRLDATDGVVLARKELPADRWTLAYAELDRRLVETRNGAVLRACAFPEPTPMRTAPATPTTTATPNL